MSQLFVLYTPFVRIPRDIPNSLHITLSDVYVEKDRDATISGTFRDWMSDKPMLPSEMYLFVETKRKEPVFDYLHWYGDIEGIWIISELFYSYLKPYIEHQAEVTRCRVFNSIRYESTRTYYVMRVYRFDNRLLNRHEKEKIKDIEDSEIFFFPSISTRKSQPSKPVFFFDELRYSDVMLLTEEGYQWVKQHLYKPQVYLASDYPTLNMHQFVEKSIAHIHPL